MTVPDSEMEYFINVVSHDSTPIYYSLDELTPDMVGKEIIVNGRPLNDNRGELVKIQGSRKRRLIVEIKGFIAAVEVHPDYIQFL